MSTTSHDSIDDFDATQSHAFNDALESSLPSDFPHYHDGDVLIVLSDKHHYQLHSQTLCINSAYFRLVLTEENVAKPSPSKRQTGAVVRWRFDLSPNPTDDGDIESVGVLTMMV